MKKILILFTAVMLSLGSHAQISRVAIQAKIDAWITTNGNRAITGAQQHEILTDLNNSTLNIISDNFQGTRIHIIPSSFSGNDYSNPAIENIAAEADFWVFADDGAGTKLKAGTEYTYDSPSGTITIPSGPGYFWILKF